MSLPNTNCFLTCINFDAEYGHDSIVDGELRFVIYKLEVVVQMGCLSEVLCVNGLPFVHNFLSSSKVILIFTRSLAKVVGLCNSRKQTYIYISSATVLLGFLSEVFCINDALFVHVLHRKYSYDIFR